MVIFISYKHVLVVFFFVDESLAFTVLTRKEIFKYYLSIVIYLETG